MDEWPPVPVEKESSHDPLLLFVHGNRVPEPSDLDFDLPLVSRRSPRYSVRQQPGTAKLGRSSAVAQRYQAQHSLDAKLTPVRLYGFPVQHQQQYHGAAVRDRKLYPHQIDVSSVRRVLLNKTISKNSNFWHQAHCIREFRAHLINP